MRGHRPSNGLVPSRALSVAMLLIVLGPSAALAFGTTRYTLEKGRIVIKQDGSFEEFGVGCEETHQMVEQNGSLFIACGPRGVAGYSVLDPLRPVLDRRIEHGPCEHLAADGTCANPSR